MKKNRDNKIDSLKGFLIILVILGHLIGSNSNVINECAKTFIYTFHMPLFILISGYLTKVKDNTKDFWKGLLNIVVPLCIFQVINIICILVISGQFDHLLLVTPYWTLWYMLSLAFWRIMLQYSPKGLLNNPVIYLPIAFILSILCGLIPDGRIMSIQRTVNFFPFFLIGYYINKRAMPQPDRMWNKFVSAGLIVTIIVLITVGFYPSNSSILLRGADQYTINDIPAKICMLVFAFVVSISVYNLRKESDMLAYIGRDSLLYYLYHGLIIKFVVHPMMSYLNLPETFPYCIAVLVMIYVMGKIKVFRWLCNPFSKKATR